MLQEYEMLYIIPNIYSENELPKIQDQVRNILKKHDSEIVKSGSLGRRKLAYTIKQFQHGYYILEQFKTEPAKLHAINQSLRVTDEVLRHMIVKFDHKWHTLDIAYQKRREAEDQAQAAEKNKAEEKAKEKERRMTEKPRTQPKPRPIPTSADLEKSLKNLDEKLDKMVEGSDLKNI